MSRKPTVASLTKKVENLEKTVVRLEKEVKKLKREDRVIQGFGVVCEGSWHQPMEETEGGSTV